jgi:hypothetical protein
MKKYFPVILLLAVWIFILPSVAYAQDNRDIQIVDAEGAGLIVNDDFARGRNIAIRNALQKAVEHVVLTLIPSKATVKKSQAIRDHIYARSDKYIHDYRIISEKQIQAVYSVNIRAKLFVASIRDDLQTIGFLKGEKDRIPATAISISIRGIKSCADYMKVLELMKTKVTGVSNLYQRRLEWGMARLDLHIQGTVHTVTDDLTKTGLFSLNQSRMNQNYIEVTYLKE